MSRQSCSEVRTELDLLLDRPEGPEAELLHAHLAGCPDCREELAARQALDLALEGLGAEVDPPPRLWTNLQARLAEEPLPSASWQVRLAGLLKGLAGTHRLRTVLGSTFVFLLAYRAFWWAPGLGLPPVREPELRWNLSESTFHRTMSKVYEDETREALEEALRQGDYRWGLLDDALQELGAAMEKGAEHGSQ